VIKDRPGRFELADGGTIFLDDIDDVPLSMQVKLHGSEEIHVPAPDGMRGAHGRCRRLRATPPGKPKLGVMTKVTTEGQTTMECLTWLEHSGFAMTIKQSTVLYELPLVLHAIGMAILVGFSTAVYVRILGLASSVPLAPLERFFPVMYAGFWINAASGVLLFILYPIKAVTNPRIRRRSYCGWE
jgi:hypothetical protein